MAEFRGGYIAPVQPNGFQGNITGKKHQSTGDSRTAAQIVDDDELLEEVIRRACLVRPGFVRGVLEETDERMTTVLKGGYIERYGRTGGVS